MEKTYYKNQMPWYRRIMQSAEFGVLLPLLFVIIITTIVNSEFFTVYPEFLSIRNFSTMLKIIPFIAICALGISFPLMTGNVDISVGRTLGLAGMVFPYCMIVHNINPVISLIIALLVGGLVGFVNGNFVVRLGLPDFVATIGTLYIAGGARFLLTKGYPLSPLPYDIGKIGSATPLGLSWPFFIMLALYIIVGFVMKKTLFGRRLLATGDNREVAALSGINVPRMRITAYTICGFLAAIGGILYTIDLDNGVPQNGDGYEFKAIASCAVGGVSLAGGKGSALGVFIGVFMVNLMDNALVMMGITSTLQKTVTGVVLAGAVMFDLAKQRQKIKV